MQSNSNQQINLGDTGQLPRMMIVGVTGSGKSTLLRHILKLYNDMGIYYVLYDSQHQHDDLAKSDMELDILKANPNANFIYQPEDVDNIDEFEKICKYVWTRKNAIFAVENLDFYATPQKSQPQTFKKIIHLGRQNSNIGVIMTTRRIADVHKSPCSQVSHWFIFRTFLPNDVKYLKEFVGDTALEAMTLEPYHFIYWTFGQVQVCKPLEIET